MNFIKRTAPYILGLALSVICILCMFINILVVPGVLGINGFVLVTVSGLGAWHVLACIFHVLLFILLLFIANICILKILDEANLIKFDVTFRKVTPYILLKLSMFLILIVGIVELFLLWFTILANDIYSIVFGAGIFVVVGLLLIGFILFFYFDRLGYFNKWSGTNTNDDKTEPEIIIENDDANEEQR